MRALSLLIILFVFWGNSFSQKFSDHHVALTPETAPTSTFNKEEYKKKLYDKYKGEPAKYLDPYVTMESEGQERFFKSNEIYTNWSEATEFVRKVFEQSIPKQFNTAGVKVFVVRDATPNAYTMEDGNICVHTGLLALINTEAELAAILCHEYGHYYHNHVYKGFKNAMQTEFNGNSIIINFLLNDQRSRYSKDNERTADTFGVSFFKQNGYDLEEIVKKNESFIKLNEKEKELRAYNKRLLYFSTHPSSEERVATAKAAAKKWNKRGKRFQIADSLQFLKIKKRAIDECIYLLFEDLLYPECIELAYLQHLYAPDDEFYRFFILESLRRYMAVDATYKQYFFVTNAYKKPHDWPKKPNFEPVFLSYNDHKNTDFSRSIFNNYDLVYDLDEKALTNVKAKSLVKNDSIEFTTNIEAYDYFLHTQNSNACMTNVIKALNGMSVDMCPESSGSDELESDYLKNAMAYKNYESDPDSKFKTAIVALRLRVTNSDGEEFSDQTNQKELYKTFVSIADTFNRSAFDGTAKLNFRNMNKLQNILYAYKQFISMGNTLYIPYISILPEKCNFLDLFPEFAGEFAQRSYKNIILLDVSVIYGSGNSMWKGAKTWNWTIHFIDLVNDKITKESLVPQPQSGSIKFSTQIPAAKLIGEPNAVIPYILTKCNKMAGIEVAEPKRKSNSYWDKKAQKNGKEEQKEEAKKTSYWDKKDKLNGKEEQKEEPKKASYWDAKNAEKKAGSNKGEKTEETYWEHQEKLRENGKK